MDHLLDVRISADRSAWSWKDEDELDEAVARGIYTQEDARSFRAAGERGVAHVLDGEPPFDADWSTWTPDPGGRRRRCPPAGMRPEPAFAAADRLREPVRHARRRGVRSRFPALSRPGPGEGVPLVYADAPGGSQVPDDVIEAVSRPLSRGVSNTHGAFPTSEETDAAIASARRAAADLTGADPGEIVFGPNATTLLFHLSRSFATTLGTGDEVVVTRLDHDANVRPWVLAARDAGATVRWVDVRDRGRHARPGRRSTRRSRSGRSSSRSPSRPTPSARSRPPPSSSARAKEIGAVVALDGVHFAQHRLLDLHGVGADVVACSPYKFFGPHLGVLAVRRSLLESVGALQAGPRADEAPSGGRRARRTTRGSPGLARRSTTSPSLGGTSEAEPPRAPDRRLRRDRSARAGLAERFLGGGRSPTSAVWVRRACTTRRTDADVRDPGRGRRTRRRRRSASASAGSSCGTATTTRGRLACAARAVRVRRRRPDRVLPLPLGRGGRARGRAIAELVGRARFRNSRAGSGSAALQRLLLEVEQLGHRVGSPVPLGERGQSVETFDEPQHRRELPPRL